MSNIFQDRSVIVITGMHRSGTSLTTSLLENAGVDIGDRLMGADTGNSKGHFEDLDFVEFHQNVLQSQGISVAGWTEHNSIEVQPQYVATAKDLISARQDKSIWGWKDPRTTLFLNFWSELIPQAKYLFVYRSPWEVVDSLFRRGDVIFRTNPNFAVKQWCNYNQLILDFYQNHTEQCLLVELGSVAKDSNTLVDLIEQKWQLNLKQPKSVYQPSLLTTHNSNNYRQALITKFFPEAIALYNELQTKGDRHEDNVTKLAIDPTCQSWILQDWIDIKQISQEKKQLENRSAQAQLELQNAEDKLTQRISQSEAIETQLAQTQLELQNTKDKLSQSEAIKTQLAQTKLELQNTKDKLSQSEAIDTQLAQAKLELLNLSRQSEKNLCIANKEIEKFGSLVRAMESSKFWQFRQKWFAIKRNLNIKSSDRLYQEHLESLTSDNFSESSVKPSDTYSEKIYRGKNISYFKWLKENFPQKAALKKTAWAIKSKLSFTPPVNIQEPPQSKDSNYQKWLDLHYPDSYELSKISKNIRKINYQPKISIIVPVYNPNEDFLRQAIESVLAQVYSNWELCLADDCSSKPEIAPILEEYACQDSRIKIVLRDENGHISRASNSAMEVATGEYIALLDHDDLLAPHALAEVVKLLDAHPEADFIYSDEDKVNEQNIHSDPYFKADWCPDSFLSRMYTCHLGVYRRSLVNEIGNFRVGFEGSQDYDLVLRITEKTDNIFHIPNILYHWRIHFESTAAFAEAKTYAFDAGKKAIQEAIARREEPGEVISKVQFPGVYTVRYQIEEHKLVSIIIPTKDLGNTLDTCLKSIFSLTTYPNYEVVVIDNGSVEDKTHECFDYWREKESDRFKCYRYDVPFNYSRINNYGVVKARGEYLLFLNNDTEVISSDWLEAMVEQAQRKSIGAVGGLLLYPDDTIQHAGVVLGLGGVAGHSHKYFPVSSPGYASQIVSTNNYSAVTAACLMCRREVFEEVGGLEEDLAIAFNDVDFCLKIRSRGYRNIYLPHVVLYHYESKSRGYEDTPEKQARFAKEIQYMQKKWQLLGYRDPCYNPNLTESREDYSLDV